MFKVAQAVSDGNSVEYGAQVHALRSSAANVGARRLYKLCLEWRELTRDELVASGSSRFVQLQGEFSAAERALRERHDYTDRAHPKSAVAAMARAG
jgi:two-component system sensor histidine kinase RpfC